MTEQPAGVLIGMRLKFERERLGWSQQQLAIQAGVTRPWIASLETGGSGDPGAEDVAKVVRAMGADIWYVLTGVRSGEGPSAPVLRRLDNSLTPEQLGLLERLGAAMFIEPRPRKPPKRKRGAKPDEHPADSDADSGDLGAR